MTGSRDLYEEDAGNPLLTGLPPEKTFSEWADSLYFKPRLETREGSRPPLESHIKIIQTVNIPTGKSIELSLSLYTLLISSLRDRNPREAQNRRRIYELAGMRHKDFGDELERMPWFAESATGAVIMGPTGCSKSHSVNAMLRGIPQVIEHGVNEDCGWRALKQLVYLKVPMPADASRNGLLFNISAEIDRVLGTKYDEQIRKQATIERRLIDVLTILMQHRCGLLILEEVQARNVVPSVLGLEFATVFLRVLNCGIPLILIGNPISFAHLLNFSQDLRRLTAGGLFEFYPSYDEKDGTWVKDLVPEIWAWSIFAEPDELVENLPAVLYQRTGGVPDFLVKYRSECLVRALRSGSTKVTRQHMDEAHRSPAMKGLHKLIRGYVNKDLQVLSGFSDQPIAFLSERWQEETEARETPAL